MITHLFCKVAPGEPMLPAESLSCEVGVGITGNYHIGDMTPRQVLITSAVTLQEYELTPGDLRENLVIQDLRLAALQSGDELTLGSCKLRITFACEPCDFIEKLQPGLLRKLVSNVGDRGILAVVSTSGSFEIGDSISSISRKKYPGIPYKIPDRIAWLVAQIPPGKLLSYRSIVEGLGLFRSSYRALPALLKRLPPEKYPIHRITNSAGELFDNSADTRARLAGEGVSLAADVANLANDEWNTRGIYLKSVATAVT